MNVTGTADKEMEQSKGLTNEGAFVSTERSASSCRALPVHLVWRLQCVPMIDELLDKFPLPGVNRGC